MSMMVTELYDALRKAGVDEPLARSAATAVLGTDALAHLATKSDISVAVADLRTAIADTKTELIKWNVGAMAILTAIFAAIVRLG